MGNFFYIILDKDVERKVLLEIKVLVERKGILEYIDLIYRIYVKML